MNSVTDRLVGCFSVVFPDLGREEIPRATAASVPKWDSVAIVTIAAVIEEEFRIAITSEEYEQLTSFELVRNLVQQKLPNDAS